MWLVVVCSLRTRWKRYVRLSYLLSADRYLLKYLLLCIVTHIRHRSPHRYYFKVTREYLKYLATYLLDYLVHSPSDKLCIPPYPPLFSFYTPAVLAQKRTYPFPPSYPYRFSFFFFLFFLPLSLCRRAGPPAREGRGQMHVAIFFFPHCLVSLFS